MRVAKAKDYPSVGGVAGPVRVVCIMEIPAGASVGTWTVYRVGPEGFESDSCGTTEVGNTAVPAGIGAPPTQNQIADAAENCCDDSAIEWAEKQPSVSYPINPVGTAYDVHANRAKISGWFPIRWQEIQEKL